MIDLYYWPTPNGWKITIMLEECGIPYNLKYVNIGAGEQFNPEFLNISPNNRMPAIVDHEPLGGGTPLSVFESGAILEYLAEKPASLCPGSQGPNMKCFNGFTGKLEGSVRWRGKTTILQYMHRTSCPMP
jgi:glutathione S-transferase